ncbi:VWFA domain-containing protein [Gammaproteobacteria bacterium]
MSLLRLILRANRPSWLGGLMVGRRFFFLIFLTFWVGLCMASPVAPPVTDLRILIDVSGSMKRTDPNNIRRPALRLLAGLLPKGSRAGVWTFGQQVNRLVPLGLVNEPWKARALASADEIHSVDRYTDIESVLRQATQDWKEAGEGKRGVILLTDGVVEPSDDMAVNETSHRRILDEILPRLAHLGVNIYTIALSAEADQALLNSLAQGSGGWFETTSNAADLHRLFLRVFEHAVKPDTLPLTGNKFKVDGSISEVTLLLLHKPEAPPLRVQPPGGKFFDILHVPKNVRWHPDQGFDLITLEKPVAGEWQLDTPVDPDNRVTIVSDLKMQIPDLPNRVAEGARIPLSVTFHDKSGQITQDSFLQQIQVGAILQSDSVEPVPQAVTVPVKDAGYSGSEFWINLDTRGGAGVMELVMWAESKTFSRERRQSFEILPALQAEQVSGGRLLRLTATPGVTEPGSLIIQALLEPNHAAAPTTLPLVAETVGLWTLNLTPPPEGGQLRILWQAKDLQGRPLSGELVPIPLEPSSEPPAVVPPAADHTEPLPAVESHSPESHPPEVATVSPSKTHWWWWAGLNAMLLLLSGAGWFLWRRFHHQMEATLLEIETDHPDGSSQEHARVDL